LRRSFGRYDKSGRRIGSAKDAADTDDLLAFARYAIFILALIAGVGYGLFLLGNGTVNLIRHGQFVQDVSALEDGTPR
jgi:hypothetical protein